MLTNGQKLDGRYVIREEIGSGGFGAVYLAEDTRFSGNNRVAIKKIIVAGRESDRAFRHEADLLYNLNHPNLPKVSNCFQEANANFIVMDYISGEDLAQKLKKGVRFSVPEVLAIADTVLDALEYLHSFLIFHRDIKPHNIKIDDQGRTFLLDFGTAKGSIDETTLTQRTSGQSVTGFTPFYAPLEQILRVDTNSFLLLKTTDSPLLDRFLNNRTDARSDIYSLGATLYHLLTGFSPEKATATVRAHAIWSGNQEPLPDCRSMNPEIPDGLAAAIKRCMEILPEDRFQSAAALRLALIDQCNPSITEDETMRIGAESGPFERPESVIIHVDDQTANVPDTSGGQPLQETVNFSDPTSKADSADQIEVVPFVEPFPPINLPSPPALNRNRSMAKVIFFVSLTVLVLAVAGFGIWLAVRNWKTEIAVNENRTVGNEDIAGRSANTEKLAETGPTRTMDYSLLVQKMRDGKKFQEPFESSGQEIFESGYQFQMRFSPPDDGFLYIFAEGLDANSARIYNIIFPTPVRNDGKATVVAGKKYETGWNEFGGKPGTENFWIIWTKAREDFLESVRDNAFVSETGELTESGLEDRLKDYLADGKKKRVDSSKETAAKRTKINFSGDSAVYLIELEHR